MPPTGPAPRGASPLRRFGPPAVFILVLFVLLWMRRPDPDDTLAVYAFDGPIMGTRWSAKVVLPHAQSERAKRVPEVVEAALVAVDQAMSTYKTDSELSRLNRHPVGEPFELSGPLYEVLKLSMDVHDASGGAFDVTVGPLVDAWGFGPAAVNRAPTERELEALGASVGKQWLRLDDASRTAQRLAPGLRVDLSAIAKGYGVDQAAQALDELGMAHYLVEIGGDVRARGLNHRGEPWQLGIERPDTPTRQALGVVPLRDRSMATSGDYRNLREYEGARVSHTIDPRTRRPITHGLASVSVVHERCDVADAWATALNVLGPDEGLDVATRQGLAASFILRHPEGFEERSTPAFVALLRAQ